MLLPKFALNPKTPKPQNPMLQIVASKIRHLFRLHRVKITKDGFPWQIGKKSIQKVLFKSRGAQLQEVVEHAKPGTKSQTDEDQKIRGTVLKSTPKLFHEAHESYWRIKCPSSKSFLG